MNKIIIIVIIVVVLIIIGVLVWYFIVQRPKSKSKSVVADGQKAIDDIVTATKGSGTTGAMRTSLATWLSPALLTAAQKTAGISAAKSLLSDVTGHINTVLNDTITKIKAAKPSASTITDHTKTITDYATTKIAEVTTYEVTLESEINNKPLATYGADLDPIISFIINSISTSLSSSLTSSLSSSLSTALTSGSKSLLPHIDATIRNTIVDLLTSFDAATNTN